MSRRCVPRDVACLLVVVVLGRSVLAVEYFELRDHIANVMCWNEIGLLDHWRDPDPLWAAIAAAPVEGDGRLLHSMGLVWAHARMSDGQPNGGDLGEIRYYFRFFPDYSALSPGALYDAPAQPNWEALIAVPLNDDWATPVGSFLEFDLLYSRVDLSGLFIRTVPGQTHWVTLVPFSAYAAPSIVTAVSFSTGAGAVGSGSDWYFRGGNLGGVGPGLLSSLDENHSFVAFQVISYEPRGDYNADGWVDGIDYGVFASCFNGAGNPPPAASCALADFDGDGDVDGSDFGWFAACFNGSGNPPNC